MIEATVLIRQTLDTVVLQYNRKIMNNIHRAEYVECLVANLLGKEWTLPWTEGWDWASWDLRHESGTTLEVKQSAARQRWHRGQGSTTRPPRFDIAPRSGRWNDESEWVNDPGRAADIYVFAWHAETDESLVDQRNPKQWGFFVVPTVNLPPEQKSIGLTGIEALAPMVRSEALSPTVQTLLND